VRLHQFYAKPQHKGSLVVLVVADEAVPVLVGGWEAGVVWGSGDLQVPKQGRQDSKPKPDPNTSKVPSQAQMGNPKRIPPAAHSIVS
jgi:hypothetical protein